MAMQVWRRIAIRTHGIKRRQGLLPVREHLEESEKPTISSTLRPGGRVEQLQILLLPPIAAAIHGFQRAPSCSGSGSGSPRSINAIM